jgi:hypothetical protein
MVETNKKWRYNLPIFIAVGIFLFLLGWWLILYITGSKSGSQNQLFSALYGSMALYGAIWGLITAKKWGGLKSAMGKAVLGFSMGLLAQEFGQITYSLYFYKTHAIPYPSIGDIGYFGTIPLYCLGTIYLAKVSGAKTKLKFSSHKLLAVLIPLVLLSVSYVIFLQGYQLDWSNPLKIFLDLGYPLGDALYISLAILAFLLTKNVLGGVMKSKIFLLLFALAMEYFADFMFLYQQNKGTEYAGGLNDLLYLISYFVMALALLQLRAVLMKIRNL